MSNDITFYSKQGEYLEDMFTLSDFLREPTTRRILEENAQRDFQSHIPQPIKEYHDDVAATAKEHSRLFHRDRRGLAVQEIIYAIYKNVEKKYELDVFYEKPSLASALLDKKK